jgi:hypothetical protein
VTGFPVFFETTIPSMAPVVPSSTRTSVASFSIGTRPVR